MLQGSLNASFNYHPTIPREKNEVGILFCYCEFHYLCCGNHELFICKCLRKNIQFVASRKTHCRHRARIDSRFSLLTSLETFNLPSFCILDIIPSYLDLEIEIFYVHYFHCIHLLQENLQNFLDLICMLLFRMCSCSSPEIIPKSLIIS